MSNEDLLHEDNHITKYVKQAQRILRPYYYQDPRKFHLWLNEFEYVADIICVPDNKMIEFFKCMVHKDLHAHVREHFPSANVFELSYKEIVDIFFRHFRVYLNENLHMLQFNSRKQYEDEPIEKYAYNLKKIYDKCTYKRRIIKRLRKQFIEGVSNNDLREYLSEVSYIEYDEVVKEAIQYEKTNILTHYLDKALLTIPIYNPFKEGAFYTWLNKFEYVADNISVPDNKMIELFNKMINNDVHISVRKTFQNVNFSKLPYEGIIIHYLRHFSTKRINLHKRRFTKRQQYEEETISKYAENLRKIYNKCNYKSRQITELCSVFKSGIRDDEMRTYLNKTSKLSFNKIVEKAIEYEKYNPVVDYVNQALLKINIYNPKNEGIFDAWLNRFEFLADIIGVPDNKMIKFFNRMMNNDVHRFVRKTYSSINFSKLSYEELINFFFRHFSQNEMDLEKARFMCRKQYIEESIEQYANSLRRLYCRSNYTNQLEEELCKQFQCGIRYEEIRTHLNQFPTLLFDDMVAEAIEFAKVNLLTYYLDQALLKINIYNPKTEGMFYAWLNKFEFIADIIGVPDNKMIEFFNKMVHNDVHILVQESYYFVSLVEPSYEEIIESYLFYFRIRNEENLYRTQFFSRKQYKEEPIEHYACTLRNIYNKCYFEMKSEKILCVQFLNGLRDDDKQYDQETRKKYKKMRNLLCKTPDLRFDETVEEVIKFAKVNLITYYLDQALLKINIYNPKKEGEFYIWLNKFEFVADYLGVPGYIMDKFFNNMVNNDFHMLVKKSFPTVNFSEFPYNWIILHYHRYFFPNEVTLLRTRFICRKQYEEESIERYANSLQRLYYKCNYTSRLKEELCLQFLHGIRDKEIRTYLNIIPRLTFEETVAEAIAFAKVVLISDYIDQALLKINIYNPRKEGLFCPWLNKFEYIADTIGVPDYKMIEFFNKMVDNHVHTSVKKAFPTVNFSNFSYRLIIFYYYFFFSLKEGSYCDDIDLKRACFVCRRQYIEESIEQYANSLQKLYNQCKYRDYQNKKLSNQFINGIHVKEIREYLKENPIVSFAETMAKAIECEKSNLLPYYVHQALLMIHTYNPKKEGFFYVWLNQFEYVADIVGVPENKMTEFFFNMVNNDVHTSVKQTLSFPNFSEHSYEEIIDFYLRFFSPFETDLHRPRFICRKQYEQETIRKYADRLRKIHDKCNYINRLEEEICEKFLCGIRDEEIKSLLSKIPIISFNLMVAEAIELEKSDLVTSYVNLALLQIDYYRLKMARGFLCWINQFEYVADKINVPDNKMVVFFKNMVKNNVHVSVQEVNSNVNIFELSYDEVISLYLYYFNSDDNIPEIMRLWLREQYDDEPIEKYVDCLRKLNSKCSYKDYFIYVLRTQFISGLRNEKLSKYLSELTNLSFNEIVAKAIEYK